MRTPGMTACALLLMACSSSSSPTEPPIESPGEVFTTPTQCLADRACSVPLTSAHRGMCGDEPENTLAAFLRCEAAGVPMLEVDTRETSDGVVVVMHDGDVTRTTDGETRFPGREDVSALTSSEFEQLVVDDSRCGGTSSDDLDRCRPPTFAQVLDRTGDETLVFLDFKAGDPARAAADILAAGAEGRVLFFDSDLSRLRAYRDAVPNGLVCPRANDPSEYDTILDPANADLDLRWIHGDPEHLPAVVPALDQAGIRLYVNGFIRVDVLLALAAATSNPEVAAQHEATAWEQLDQMVADGGDAFGTDLGQEYTAHLYPNGFGRAP